MSFQFFTALPVSQTFFSSAVVRQSTHVACGFTTTERPSIAICSSVYATPFFSHSAFSASLIGREASLMSVSLLQNFLKPPPVPEMPTVTFTSVCFFPNSSAARGDHGGRSEQERADWPSSLHETLHTLLHRSQRAGTVREAGVAAVSGG